jgi:hypothetical protein
MTVGSESLSRRATRVAQVPDLDRAGDDPLSPKCHAGGPGAVPECVGDDPLSQEPRWWPRPRA